MNWLQRIPTFFLLLIVFSCNQFSNSNLAGTWQAVRVIQDAPAEIDLSQVSFEFHESGNYSYNGTLGYKEAGYFETSKNKLLTIDTLNEGSSQKFVEIARLTKDSLTLKMLENGKYRQLVLAKK